MSVIAVLSGLSFSRDVSFSNEVVIARPVAEVYAFLADFENMPKWNYYLRSVKRISAGPLAVGTAFHQVRKSDEQDYKITELDSNSIAVETLPPYRKLQMRFEFHQERASTRVVDTWLIRVPFFLSPFIKHNVRNGVAANLEKLKVLLENGQVVLQDGRMEKL
ncbi:MAG: hypothetical protein JWO03_642 [Bacteroidetes bacterium]|nr:hypothetical protein [Bacteroidota bacterium]